MRQDCRSRPASGHSQSIVAAQSLALAEVARAPACLVLAAPHGNQPGGRGNRMDRSRAALRTRHPSSVGRSRNRRRGFPCPRQCRRTDDTALRQAQQAPPRKRMSFQAWQERLCVSCQWYRSGRGRHARQVVREPYALPALPRRPRCTASDLLEEAEILAGARVP